MTKAEYVEKKKKFLDDWSAEMKLLEAKAHKSKEDAKEDYKAHLAALHTKQKEGQKHLDSIKTAAEGSWENLKGDTEKVWSALTDSISQFRSHF